MGYHRREEVINDFMASDYDIMKLDWASMGYKNDKSCRTSFVRLLAQLDNPCFCAQRERIIYLLKPGKDLSKIKEDSSSLKIGEWKLKVAYKKGSLRALINEFLGKNNYDVFEVPWKYLDYKNAQSCYQSIRNEISIHKLSNHMFVYKDADRVYIAKKISTLILE